MLHRSGFLQLSQQVRSAAIEYRSDKPHLRDAGHAHLDAIIDGRVRLHFDTHDSCDLAADEINACDFYFKRSYSPSLVETLPVDQRNKVLPLGLNYRVFPN